METLFLWPAFLAVKASIRRDPDTYTDIVLPGDAFMRPDTIYTYFLNTF